MLSDSGLKTTKNPDLRSINKKRDILGHPVSRALSSTFLPSAREVWVSIESQPNPKVCQ